MNYYEIKDYPHKLSWENGVGYLAPLEGEHVYQKDYFEKYKKYEDTPIGENILRARIAFTLGNIVIDDYMIYTDLELTICDVGIGSGKFIRELNTGMLRGKIFGSDINPFAIKYLEENRLLRDPTKEDTDVITLWDVLEHMEDPAGYIKKVDAEYVFVSMPIYKDVEHVLRSKHLRPNEHLWYYTEESLVSLFSELGYNLLEVSDIETLVGREDILSFAFRKKR